MGSGGGGGGGEPEVTDHPSYTILRDHLIQDDQR